VLPGGRFVLQEGVYHGVADEVDVLRRMSFAQKVLVRVGGGREEYPRERIGDKTVYLLGHRAVEGTQARLDVTWESSLALAAFVSYKIWAFDQATRG